ncbi:MAG: hypothetical protein O9252_01450, partial [Algoriphagus sp.]|nr:hypothetical protein [Algoriphagus sp.]
MLKRVIIVCLLAICSGTVIGQTATDTLPKLDPKIKNALNVADQMAYQMALKYNDLEIAKNKLYDLIVRNPEDLRYMEA